MFFPWNYIDRVVPGLHQLIFPDTPPKGTGYTQKHGIDVMKGLTLPFCLALATKYSRLQSPTMMIYSALHGTYGLFWVFKSRFFGDKKWDRPVPWSQLGVTVFGLGMYWLVPYQLASSNHEHPAWYLSLWTCVNLWGVFLHFCSDLQKDLQLRYQPGKLITTGFFSISRHPNYLGEFFIYLSFVMLGKSNLMVLYFLTFVFIYWVPNMIQKETSMSRYEEWKKYCKKTPVFLFL